MVADMGVNYLERQVLLCGHQLRRVPQPEYGTDAEMIHFSPDTRELENGRVEFQVKATDHLKLIDGGKSVACRVERAHLNCWYHVVDHPFILVHYDTKEHRAFWLDIQAYLDGRGSTQDDLDTATLRIPVRNELTENAIGRFRGMSRERMQLLPRKESS